MTPNNGGPAFPEVVTHLEYNQDAEERFPNTYSVGGMTLRDYFAAKAIGMAYDLETKYSTGDQAGGTYAGIATRAYLLADAMLLAREGDKA